MGSLFNKIKYTQDAVNAIQQSLENHGINMKNIALDKYADIIKNLRTDGGTAKNDKYIWFDSGYTPKVVPLATITYDKELVYYNNNNIFSSMITPKVVPKDIIAINGVFIDNLYLYKDYPNPVLKEE